MSSGSRKGARVSSSSSSSSIPDSVRKMIQNIREITAAHDDDEIYATLKDCSMDPNETAQRLLSQDTFQEVKKKRDRRKENSGNKEAVEPKWKPGQGRGGRGGRGNYLPRHTPNDTGSRNSLIGKENTSNQASEKIAGISSSSSSLEPKKNEATATRSSATAITNGPSAIVSKGINSEISKLVSPTPNEHINVEKENSGENSETQITSPGSHFSSSDPVLVPSQDPRIPGAAGAIKREVGCQPTPADQISIFPSEGKTFTATSEVEKCSMEGNIKSIGVGNNRQSENTIRPSSAHGGSSLVRPSSNHSSRSQQVVGPPKVVPAKEWKPKSTNSNLGQGSSKADKSEISAVIEADISKSLDPKEASTKLQKKLDELNISNNQPVIIPNHLNVPGAEKISFCFGSFDAISLDTGFKNVPEDSYHSLPSETYENVAETEEQTSTLETALATAKEEDHHGHSQSPPENASPNEHSESKQEREIPQVSHQYPIIHSPGYGFGLLPTMMGSQLPPFENSESQTRDGSRVPSFVVPQPFDLASYHAQFYRSTGEGDGRVATKYNGNVAVLPPQTSQSAQEGGNSVMSTSGPTTFVTQPSSVAVTQQQPVPVFRQPYGFPFPHYPQNLINYSPYFSPYFVPHFPQPYNNVYPQQPQAGGVYQAPPGLSPKFSISQYKSGTSSGNSTSIGVASTNEDLNAQHFKENNVYIPGQQQSEGSAVWLTQPGRDISGLQANSFYNIPLPQPGHGPFTVHPFLQQSQPISTVDLSGPASNVYQQPQHTQVTWPNNNY